MHCIYINRPRGRRERGMIKNNDFGEHIKEREREGGGGGGDTMVQSNIDGK